MIRTRTQNYVWPNFFLPQYFVWLFMSQQIKNFLLPLSIAITEHMKHIWNTVTTNDRIKRGWTFINRCLSKTFNIFWPNVLFTEALWRCTQDKLVAEWTKLQKWKCAGHIWGRIPLPQQTKPWVGTHTDNAVEGGRPSRGRKTTEEEGDIIRKTRAEVKATAGNSLLALLHGGPKLLTESEEFAWHRLTTNYTWYKTL